MILVAMPNVHASDIWCLSVTPYQMKILALRTIMDSSSILVESPRRLEVQFIISCNIPNGGMAHIAKYYDSSISIFFHINQT